MAAGYPPSYGLNDKPREECGLFGVWAPGRDVAQLTYYGIFALQHRGQESAGIAVADGREIDLQRGMGLVTEVFDADHLARLQPGQAAIGHVRYSTTGSSLLVNAQPLVFRYLRGMVALAHNGNLVNATKLRSNLARGGSVFQSTTDSEVVVNLIARYGQYPIEEALLKCLVDLEGAYSLLVMTEDRLVGVRDPYGIRPLCLGRLGDGYVLTSETCALDTVGAEFVRDLEPGEVVVIDGDGLRSFHGRRATRQAFCVFEYVYLARPDSVIEGRTVNLTRRRMGQALAREHHLEADMVIPVPDSGTAAAVGFAEASGIPYQEGLIKNRYVGRTFIQPRQEQRDLGVRLKLNPVREVLQGQRVVMVDDSLVRGTTSRKLVRMLRQVGVKEVHLLISSPPITHPCYYGIDTSREGELIAAGHTVEEIRAYIEADSLHYLSQEGLLTSVGGASDLCAACFNGCYPAGRPQQEGPDLKLRLEGAC